jgi:PLP dependent protein
VGKVSENLQEVQALMAEAAKVGGQKLDDIQLVAVTKTVPVDTIKEVVEAGILQLGENRVQELLAKYEEISHEVKWHIIGHLQTNKVKYIIDKVKLIHSLDRLSLAEEINQRANQLSIIVDTLVQVNYSGEESKYGLRPNEVRGFIEKVSTMPNLRIKGFMTMAPFYNDPEDARWVFAGVKRMRDELIRVNIPNVELNILSMGMTNDYQVAIEEGANMIRVGSGIFGARQ